MLLAAHASFSARARKWKQKQAQRRGAGKAMAILAARLARAVYHMLRKKEAFDEDRFWGGVPGRAVLTGKTLAV